VWGGGKREANFETEGGNQGRGRSPHSKEKKDSVKMEASNFDGGFFGFTRQGKRRLRRLTSRGEKGEDLQEERKRTREKKARKKKPSGNIRGTLWKKNG